MLKNCDYEITQLHIFYSSSRWCMVNHFYWAVPAWLFKGAVRYEGSGLTLGLPFQYEVCLNNNKLYEYF